MLADSIVAAAYGVAVSEAPPPASAAYRADNQMMVIALGRLGMREFDLGSDADLVFVLPDADAAEHAFWHEVAERMIQLLSAYTGEGLMFTVDTRLRPNGRDGDLVQTEGAYKNYFAQRAEAWEGIAYMKTRGVAGDVERATAFLHELQDVGLAPLRAKHALAQGAGRNARPPRARPGTAQSAEGRHGRLL